MTSDASNLPEHIPALPLEARAAPAPDDPVAARLRGFGPVVLLAILVIVLTSVVKPLSAILVLVWPGGRIRHGVRSATCDPRAGLAVWPPVPFSAARLNS